MILQQQKNRKLKVNFKSGSVRGIETIAAGFILSMPLHTKHAATMKHRHFQYMSNTDVSMTPA
jgi:hypothetical protein